MWWWDKQNCAPPPPKLYTNLHFSPLVGKLFSLPTCCIDDSTCIMHRLYPDTRRIIHYPSGNKFQSKLFIAYWKSHARQCTFQSDAQDVLCVVDRICISSVKTTFICNIDSPKAKPCYVVPRRKYLIFSAYFITDLCGSSFLRLKVHAVVRTLWIVISRRPNDEIPAATRSISASRF